jgi:hypothetical protein
VSRRLTSALLIVMLFGAAVAPAADARIAGAVTWTVDQSKKTITVVAQLTLYSGCSGGHGTEPKANLARACTGTPPKVTPDVAAQIKARIERVWNHNYRYRCYKLIFIVDINTVPDPDLIADGRIGIRIDPSPVALRSWVHTNSNDKANWGSNDPADRLEPENGGNESTWFSQELHNGIETFAHEFGHVLGLHDYYFDAPDEDGNVEAVKYPLAPDDLMANAKSKISQETINRVLERNSDNLVDTKGNKLGLDDLVCDPGFIAFFSADQVEYGASNIMDSVVDPPCSRAAETSSIDQSLKVDGEKVGLRVVEAPESPLGYVLVPEFDVLTLQGGLRGGGRASGAVGMFDIPITVRVERGNSRPARAAVPAVIDIPFRACPGGDVGHSPEPNDCGARQFPSWLAISQQGNRELWPVGSSLPFALADLGYQSPRLDLLYKRCSGPKPWPGGFVDQNQPGTTIKRGRAPSRETLASVWTHWVSDGTPDKVTITGSAEWKFNVPGTLVDDWFDWTLTLCPVTKDGDTPPDCP